ncbi:hypothetical protein Lal_00038433 [Lupinus albus]|nr:hypothetical protein Lal_00038433 [Lupinus albus]
MTSTLGINGFLRVSKCKFTKEIWDTLETNHEVKENPFKGKAEKKTRKAYIAWEDNDDCSNSKL